MAPATIAVIAAEATALVGVVAGLDRSDLSRPSPCPPWTVAGLLGHVIVAVSRIREVTAGPPDSGDQDALVSAAGYYRPDQRFAPTVNAARIAAAQAVAADLDSPAAYAAGLDRSCREATRLLEQAPAGRVIRSRHGDRMLLSEFATTRVVELGVHGLDLAIALGRVPWLTPAAGAVLERLMLPAGTASRLRDRLRVDQAGLIAVLTGRAALSAADEKVLRTARVARLPLG